MPRKPYAPYQDHILAVMWRNKVEEKTAKRLTNIEAEDWQPYQLKCRRIAQCKKMAEEQRGKPKQRVNRRRGNRPGITGQMIMEIEQRNGIVLYLLTK